MRKVLEPFSLLALGILVAITILALFGDESLPPRIPIRFDPAGYPIQWGSPVMLLMLPSVAIVVYLLFTVVTKVPSIFQYPVHVTTRNRQRLQSAAFDMIAWLKLEFVCLFTWVQWATVRVVRHPELGLPVIISPLTLVAVFATIACYTAIMFRLERQSIGLD